MLQVIPTLKDFLDEDALKHLLGNLKVQNCILLKESKVVDGLWSTYLHVFDEEGVLIGTIDKTLYLSKRPQ